MKSLLKISATFVVIAFFFSSCSIALLTSSWSKQGTTPQQYKKILVLAIGKNTSGRAAVEDAMIKEFKVKKINAVSALDVFPNFNPEVALEKAAVAQALSDKGIDGFLILSVLDVKSEQVYVQGQTRTEAVSTAYHPNGYYNRYYPDYSNYYGYYNTVYQTVQEPGYYQDQTTYYLESNFYNVKEEMLIWSGQCEAVDPANIGSGAKDWAGEVVGGLLVDKIIIP